MSQLHRLEGFFHVARHGGYARAARAFPYPITQPGVHQQVSRLERDLGVILFERTGHDQVALTAAGRRLFDFCRPFFEELPLLARSLREGHFGGRLRIEVGALEIRHLMPAWIRALRKSRPDIDVEVTERRSADARRLTRGEVDLIVDHLPSTPSGIATRVVGEHTIFLVLPASHPLAQRKRLGLGALGDHPFVAYAEDDFARGEQQRALDAHGAAPARWLSASTTEGILGFVQAGLGYSLIPWPKRDGPRVEGVRAVRLRGPGSTYPIHAAWRQGPVTDPLVQAALAAL